MDSWYNASGMSVAHLRHEELEISSSAVVSFLEADIILKNHRSLGQICRLLQHSGNSVLLGLVRNVQSVIISVCSLRVRELPCRMQTKCGWSNAVCLRRSQFSNTALSYLIVDSGAKEQFVPGAAQSRHSEYLQASIVFPTGDC